MWIATTLIFLRPNYNPSKSFIEYFTFFQLIFIFIFLIKRTPEDKYFKLCFKALDCSGVAPETLGKGY